jgi:hypothetical protein
MNALVSAQRLAQATDKTWRWHLELEFGKKADDVRDTPEGQGKPGSLLRSAYEARKAAHERWHALKGCE